MSNKIIVKSYNLLHEDYAKRSRPEYLPDDGTQWKTRAGQAVANIRAYQTDILCVQETTQSVFNDLQKSLGLDGRYAKHVDPKKTDGVGILFNPLRFTYLDTRTFKDTGNSDLSMMYTDLRENDTGKIIRVASTHLKGGPTRSIGDAQLRKGIIWMETKQKGQEYRPDIQIIAGDLNQDQFRSEHSSSRLDLVTAVNYSTSKDLKGTEIEKVVKGSSIAKRKLDWIFVKDNSNPSNRPSSLDTSFLPPASDHHMVANALFLTPPKSSKVEEDDSHLGDRAPSTIQDQRSIPVSTANAGQSTHTHHSPVRHRRPIPVSTANAGHSTNMHSPVASLIAPATRATPAQQPSFVGRIVNFFIWLFSSCLGSRA